jgi:hypothetical protein
MELELFCHESEHCEQSERKNLPDSIALITPELAGPDLAVRIFRSRVERSLLVRLRDKTGTAKSKRLESVSGVFPSDQALADLQDSGDAQQ